MTNSAPELPSSLSDQELKAFQRLVIKATGIQLDESKRSMVYTRFLRRLRALNLHTFGQYIELLESGNEAELRHFINTITTNLTYFFREPHHFEFLRATVVPDMFGPSAQKKTVRIWSAGCSSGEEPYSIASSLAEEGFTGGADYRLLCTDIDTDMVRRTKTGEFRGRDVRGLSEALKSRWFEQRNGDILAAKDALKKGLMCRDLNLFAPWPIRPGVDIIFCRNVLIYFDRKHQEQIVRGFADVQSRGAYLFLGHSESLRDFDDVYERVGNTIYKRV
ncbi:MAG: protein-glutamate O-methyltransferase CheR [Gammaproteobacteria bacterium]